MIAKAKDERKAAKEAEKAKLQADSQENANPNLPEIIAVGIKIKEVQENHEEA